MGIQCWGDLVKYGVNNMLESEYGEWLIRDGPEKEQEYDVSLLIDLEKIPEDEGRSVSVMFRDLFLMTFCRRCRVAFFPHLPSLNAQTHDFLRAIPTRLRIT